jgi:hypothetical protein
MSNSLTPEQIAKIQEEAFNEFSIEMDYINGETVDINQDLRTGYEIGRTKTISEFLSKAKVKTDEEIKEEGSEKYPDSELYDFSIERKVYFDTVKSCQSEYILIEEEVKKKAVEELKHKLLASLSNMINQALHGQELGEQYERGVVHTCKVIENILNSKQKE